MVCSPHHRIGIVGRLGPTGTELDLTGTGANFCGPAVVSTRRKTAVSIAFTRKIDARIGCTRALFGNVAEAKDRNPCCPRPSPSNTAPSRIRPPAPVRRVWRERDFDEVMLQYKRQIAYVSDENGLLHHAAAKLHAEIGPWIDKDRLATTRFDVLQDIFRSGDIEIFYK